MTEIMTDEERDKKIADHDEKITKLQVAVQTLWEWMRGRCETCGGKGWLQDVRHMSGVRDCPTCRLRANQPELQPQPQPAAHPAPAEQKPKVDGHCAECGKELYEGHARFFDDPGIQLCSDRCCKAWNQPAEQETKAVLPCRHCGSEARIVTPQNAWRCLDIQCFSFGPMNDPDAAKWNAQNRVEPVRVAGEKGPLKESDVWIMLSEANKSVIFWKDAYTKTIEAQRCTTCKEVIEHKKELEASIASLESENARLNTSLEKAKGHLADWSRRNTELGDEVARLTNELAQAKQQVETLEEQRSEAFSYARDMEAALKVDDPSGSVVECAKELRTIIATWSGRDTKNLHLEPTLRKHFPARSTSLDVEAAAHAVDNFYWELRPRMLSTVSHEREKEVAAILTKHQRAVASTAGLDRDNTYVVRFQDEKWQAWPIRKCDAPRAGDTYLEKCGAPEVVQCRHDGEFGKDWVRHILGDPVELPARNLSEPIWDSRNGEEPKVQA